jgi:multidrug efflux pump subunit AcrA (membrane-fusion protein)
MMPPAVRSCRVAALLGGLLVSCLASGCGQATQPLEDEHLAEVKVVQAKEELLAEWTDLPGTTQPVTGRSARLSAAVEGRVLSVLGNGKGTPLVEGQAVSAGQVIVQLDDRIPRANRDRLQAAHEELKEQKNQADNAVELARLELEAKQKLLRLNGSGDTTGVLYVSKLDVDRARIALKDAESKQKAVLAREEASAAELRAQDEQLALYALRAPIAGRLGLIQVALGQTIPPGTTVAEVVDLDEIDVLCFAPPHLAGRFAVGQPARLVTDGDQAPDESAPGKVVYVAVQAQPDTGNVAVKVRFPNPELRLRGGKVSHVQVLTRSPEKRWTIPEAALLEDQDPPAVLVVETEKNEKGEEEKKVHRVPVEIGVRGWDHERKERLVEIVKFKEVVKEKEEHKEEMKEGKKEEKKELTVRDALFVIEGGNGLHDDDPVKLKEEKKEEHKDEKKDEK